MLKTNGQLAEALFLDNTGQFQWRPQLAEFPLDCDFPGAGGADVHVVIRVGNPFARAVRQGRRIGQPPQQCMGIQQEQHASATFKQPCEIVGRFVKISRKLDLTFQPPWLAGLSVCPMRDQVKIGLAGFGNHDLFALPGQFAQFGELALRLVHVELFHRCAAPL